METNQSIKNNEIKNVEINIEILKQIKTLISIVSERIHWKTDELIPVGILVKQLDDIIKNN